MIELVRQARLAKGYHARLVDRISAWFLPAVAVLAIATFAIHAAHGGFEQGLLASLAVSLIACPCALGLATPMAVWAALGRASQDQVLVRNGEALERLAAVRAMALDKTGTLTTGVARVAEFITDARTNGANSAILQVAAMMAARSNHPFSSAIAAFASAASNSKPSQPKRVASARCRDGASSPRSRRTAPLGWAAPRLMHENNLTVSPSLAQAVVLAESQARSLACVGWEGRVRGIFLLSEEIRAEAQSAVARCRELGLHVCLLTGDHPRRAGALADKLGIQVEAELLPGEKLNAIARLRKTWGAVAMVGDGINNAPALVAADVGIAMGCGADVSRQTRQRLLAG